MAPEIAATVNAPSFDTEYTWGRTPTVATPFPFNTHQFARLLVLRGRCQDGDKSSDGCYGLNQYAHDE